MILVHFLRLDLILGELVLKILFHRFYLTLYEGHDLYLVFQEVDRGTTSFGSIVRTIQSVCFVSKIHRLFTLNLTIVYKAKLLLYWQTNEALSENVPLGLGVFTTIELELIWEIEPFLFELGGWQWHRLLLWSFISITVYFIVITLEG